MQPEEEGPFVCKVGLGIDLDRNLSLQQETTDRGVRSGVVGVVVSGGAGILTLFIGFGYCLLYVCKGRGRDRRRE